MLVDFYTVAKNYIDFICASISYGILQRCCWSIMITTVKDINPISACFCNAFVHCVIYSFVWFGAPEGNVFFKSLNNINCSVSRSSINNNIFFVPPSLRNKTLNSFFYMFTVVIYYCNNGYFVYTHGSMFVLKRKNAYLFQMPFAFRWISNLHWWKCNTDIDR